MILELFVTAFAYVLCLWLWLLWETCQNDKMATTVFGIPSRVTEKAIHGLGNPFTIIVKAINVFGNPSTIIVKAINVFGRPSWVIKKS